MTRRLSVKRITLGTHSPYLLSIFGPVLLFHRAALGTTVLCIVFVLRR